MIGHDRERGQVLVLFAFMLVVLLGMAALAIDVSGVYAEQRHERSVADAAALAGASDNFRLGSTAVDNTEWTKARTHAMQNLLNQLSPGTSVLPTCAVGGSSPYSRDIVNCPLTGTPYYVSVKAPSPSCASGACDPIRSVQVTVRNPKFGLTFARLFGQFQWNLAITSVAERSLGTNYTFVTLRPPKPSRSSSGACAPNCDANEKDVFLDGSNTKLTVDKDMGTNTNMTLTNGATVALTTPGAFVDRYDAYQNWTAPPPGRQISVPVKDPNYPVPVAPDPLVHPELIFGTNAAGQRSPAACATEVTNTILSSSSNYNVSAADATAGKVVCYNPGVYNDPQGLKPDPGVTTMVFTPGVYFLNEGLVPGNNVRVIGGYQAGSQGVAFVFPTSCNPSCDFAGNAAPLVALNAGSAYPTGSGTPASAAVNWDTNPVQTTSKIPLPMTLIVKPDLLCVVAPVDTCPDENANNQLKLPGSGSMFVFGVQYAPTDNVAITGGSGSNGFLGQIWAWTVHYTGGSNINLVGAGDPKPGVLRIATACSPVTACTNPEATVVLP
jgi:Putative Flp pilus-assembly TadE/G-like